MAISYGGWCRELINRGGWAIVERGAVGFVARGKANKHLSSSVRVFL